MSDKKIYKPKDVAKLLGVSVRTLERWHSKGLLKANEYPSGRLYYYDENLIQVISQK